MDLGAFSLSALQAAGVVAQQSGLDRTWNEILRVSASEWKNDTDPWRSAARLADEQAISRLLAAEGADGNQGGVNRALYGALANLRKYDERYDRYSSGDAGFKQRYDSPEAYRSALIGISRALVEAGGRLHPAHPVQAELLEALAGNPETADLAEAAASEEVV